LNIVAILRWNDSNWSFGFSLTSYKSTEIENVIEISQVLQVCVLIFLHPAIDVSVSATIMGTDVTYWL
jgi:hypothetical protein